MSKITIDQLKSGNHAIYPRTKDEWIHFAYNMEQEGYRWDNSNKPTVAIDGWSGTDLIMVRSDKPKEMKLLDITSDDLLPRLVSGHFKVISPEEIEFPQRHAGNLTIEVANGKAVAKFYVDNRLVRTRTAVNSDPKTATEEAVRLIFDRSKFEVGDVVRFNVDHWWAREGDIATIKAFNGETNTELSLEMDEAKTTHDCDGLAKPNSGIYAYKDVVEHINI